MLFAVGIGEIVLSQKNLFVLFLPTVRIQARLATNCVTMGDMARPLRINSFVNDLHNGFRLLNLKNDNLRKKWVDVQLFDVMSIFFAPLFFF